MSYVLVGKRRPPISPDQVKIYIQPPAKYKEIALLDASSRNSWTITDQQKINKVIERLKIEAAELGANGVLLQQVGCSYGGSVNTGVSTANAYGNSAFATGVRTSVPVFLKEGSGIVIYVENKGSSTSTN